jgi:hypothetical protein
MFRILATIATLTAVPSLAAAPAAQFNLTCSGSLSSSSLAGESSEPYAATYRIDLAQKKWCEEDCKVLHDIASIQAGQLTLSEERIDSPSEKSFSVNTINRETGAHKIIASSESHHVRGSSVNMHWEGSCAPSAFGGFPSLPAKF